MDIIALLLIFCAVLFLQTVVFCRFCFYKLDYKCEFSVPEAHEGDNIYLIETVHNCKLLPVPWLKVDIHSSRWLDFAGSCSVVTQEDRRVTSSFVLKGFQKTTRRWKLKCLKRGVFITENVTLVSGDLLNFNVVSEAVPVNAHLIVYPEIIQLDKIFEPVNLLQGDRTVNRWIIDDPFMIAGAREYTYGDPLRYIHWKASARTGNLMVKKNEYTSRHGLTVLLNMQSVLYEYEDTIDKGIAELGIKTAATMFDAALKEGMAVKFATNGCTFAGAKEPVITGEAADKEHITGLFDILARLIMKNVKDFEGLLDDLEPDLENTEVVIITAYLSKRICEQADHLALKGNDVSIYLLDEVYEEGIKPEIAGLYIMKDKSLYSGMEEEKEKGVYEV